VKLRRLLPAAALLAIAPAALAQATPQATLERFVALANAGELTTPQGQALLTGEAKAMATDARSALPPADRIMPIGADEAAARFVLRGPSGEEADAYFYLEKTADGWAVSAFRAMAMTGISMMLLEELKKRKTLSDDEAAEKRNLELTLAPDSQLRRWFADNRPAVEALTVLPAPDDLSAQLRALGLSSVNAEGETVMVTVGGMVDNTVGFLRAGPAGPPAIDPSSFIWIEDLGDGWFLYRTT